MESWSHHLENFTVATMTWLTAMEFLRHKWSRIWYTFRKHVPIISMFMTSHRLCNYINTTGATSGEGTAYTSGASPVFSGVRVTRSLVLYVCFVDHWLSFVLFLLAFVLSVPLRYTDWYFKTLLIKVLPQKSLEFSCHSIFWSYSIWHWRCFVYLWWFLLFQLICKIS